IAQYLGAFTPTLTLPLEGGGRFLNDFIQLIPSPPGERVRVRGVPRCIEQIPFFRVFAHSEKTSRPFLMD
ncbi:MAG: hypothetical protein J7M30_14810, partial [Deltaproteobacteria bacterium]|nr:hypothetical protein [Deltaproteobacteria bacterium]